MVAQKKQGTALSTWITEQEEQLEAEGEESPTNERGGQR